MTYLLHYLRHNAKDICLIIALLIMTFLWLQAKWDYDTCMMDKVCPGCAAAFNEPINTQPK